MEEYDIIVIGGGSGLTVSSKASSEGLKTALIEKGPLGGTCLNRGCIPSKMLIHSGDVAETIKNSEKFGIETETDYKVNFKEIVERVNNTVSEDAKKIEKGNQSDENITLYKEKAKFVDDKKLQVGNKKITADKIIIAAGTRPTIPPIEGLDDINYLTSKEALKLKEQPETMTIVGGGYVGSELAHFFGGLGTEITIVQKDQHLIPNEDRKISEKFTQIFSNKHNVITGYIASKEKEKNGKIISTIESEDGKTKQIKSDEILIATGRKPNTDILQVEKTGVETNQYGFIKNNEYLETTRDGIWTLGDIAGNYLFKHSANLEAKYVVKNALYNQKEKADYKAMPHAIFTSPQIAGVGKTQQELEEEGKEYTVGENQYSQTGMGMALRDEDGFVRVYADPETKEILGCHIMGTDASTLIHEVIVAMKHELGTEGITKTVHIHPALPEVVQGAFNNINQ